MRLRATGLAALAVTAAGVFSVAGAAGEDAPQQPAGTPRAEGPAPPRACGSRFARTNAYRRQARRALTPPRLDRRAGRELRAIGRCLPPRARGNGWAGRVKARWHRWRRSYPVRFRLAFEREYAYLRGRLEGIAACESGGDPTAVSSTGRYRGKYQFSYPTWAAVGGSGDPAAAHEWEQDYRAAVLYVTSGPGQWPVCGR